MRALGILIFGMILSARGVVATIHFDADSFRNASQLIVSKGYAVEEHTAVTKDGYLLGMQRIPRGRNEPPRGAQRSHGPRKMPVLIVHALAVSSDDFVSNFPDQSLGFLLADAGYDVWLGNLRGNVYTHHLKYSRSERAFWQFSADELAEFDTAAMLDTVLSVTDQTALYYIGFSQGTQALFMLLSEKPQYNKKIILFMAMGPIAYIGHLTAPLCRLGLPFAEIIKALVQWFFNGAFLVNTILNKLFFSALCGDEATVGICVTFMQLANGVNWSELNVSRLAVYLSHSPSGTSATNVDHFAQLIRCNCFQKYDYGMLTNMAKYGSMHPPKYHLSRVFAPVALYYSLNDWYAVPVDVARLASELPNLVRNYQVPDTQFTHYDFALGMHAVDMVYNDMMQLMKLYARY
ncbi:lipase member K-like isoform X1 [Haemaphysalis longicornis]